MAQNAPSASASAAESKLISLWKTLRFGMISQELKQAWMEAVQRTHEPITLASLVSLGENLIPDSMWDEQCTQLILQIDPHADARVAADVIELLGNKLSSEEMQPFEQRIALFGAAGALRAKGNHLVIRAKKNLDSQVLSEIRDWVDSPDRLKSSTGVYVAREVINYYRAYRPSELALHDEYESLMRNLARLNTKPETYSARIRNFLRELAR
jgi:hypothetical protein